MAERKPLYMDTDAGFPREMPIADTATFGGLTINTGDIDLTNNATITGVPVSTGLGDAIGHGRSGAELADLTITSGGDIDVSGGGELTGLPVVPDGSTSATSKAYVDSLVAGLGWKNPVDVFRLVGNRTVAQLDALGANAGAAYVVTDADTLTRGSLAVVAGDLVEDNGTIWVLIESAVGGFVPDGLRAILSGTDTLVAPYTDATDNDKIVVFDGTDNEGTDTGDTVDKAAVLIQDSGSVGYYDNDGFVYEGTAPPGAWVQFTGTGTITAGDGLTKTGNVLDVDLETSAANTGGLAFNSTQLRVKTDQEHGIILTSTGVEVEVEASKGLSVGANGLATVIEASKGLTVGASGLATVIEANKGLTVGASGLAAVPNASAGMEVGASGLAVNLVAAAAGDGGLEFDGTDGVQVKVLADGSQAIELTSTGVAVKIGNGDQLIMDTDGLKVAGVPAPFNIGATAVSANVTAPNLGTLTAGSSSDADALHTHAGLVPNYVPMLRDESAPAGETLTPGDVVYAMANGKIGVAEAADTAIKALAIGIVDDGKTLDQTSSFIMMGRYGDGILSGMTVGSAYYLADAGGKPVLFTSVSAGSRVIRIGYAISATELYVSIADFGQKAA